MANRKRKEDESYLDYKRDLKKQGYIAQLYERGRIVWNSEERGTFIRPDSRLGIKIKSQMQLDK